MKLYFLSGCPYCEMVSEKLEELGLDYERIEVPRRRSRRGRVWAISGQPLVPVLVDGGTILDDEEDILEYLEKQYE